MLRRTFTLLPLLLRASPVLADDWPQWMGTKRDNIWRETGILEAFPPGGPKVVWRAPVAGGYSGPAVAAGKVFITDYATTDQLPEGNFQRKPTNGTERVIALDATTGQQLWKYELPVRYAISYPAGPRCTPTVEGNRVWTLGAEGHLACLDVATGKPIWTKELKDAYSTKSALWGYSAHPLIEGNKLITLAGGDGSHVVALDKATGQEIWKSQSQPEQGYVPPSIQEAAGVRQLIIAGPTAIRALNPETGARLWTTPYDADNGSIIMTPVRIGDYLFVGGYRTKNLMLKLTQDKPGVEVVWRNKKGFAISPVNVQPFVDGQVIYGFDESGELRAIEVPSGKRLWSTTAPLTGGDPLGSGTAFLTKNGDRFFLFNELGELLLAKLSPEGYEELGRAKLLNPTNTAFGRKVVWCAPAYANKKLYVRNDQELICVDLAK